MFRRTSVAALVLATTGALVGTAVAAEEDTYYPEKGNPGVDVRSYDLALSWKPSTKKLTGTATLVLTAATTDESFELDLAQTMDVSSVTVNGVGAAFVHDGKDLAVAHPVVPGGSYTVVIRYAGKPRTVAAPTSREDSTGLGWHKTADGRVWTMQKPFGAYTWYPVNDHPSDKALYTVRLSVPDKFVGVSNGRLDAKATANGRTVTTFVNGKPTAAHLVTVAIGPYKKYSQTGPRGLPLTYWVPKGKKELVKPLMRTAETLSWLEKRLGPYPFERAGVVVTPGMSSVESQTLITLAQDNYRYGGSDVQEQVAHNLVHAWYGGTVTPNDWSELWMAEGMATYLQAKFTVARGWDTWDSQKRQFRRNDGYWRDIYGPPGAYFKYEFGQRNVHYGTALMLERLRATIGATKFNQVMREWPQSNLNKTRGRAAYIDFVETSTGKELSKFFNEWLTSPTTPTS